MLETSCYLLIYEFIVDILVSYEGLDVLISLCTLIPQLEGTVIIREPILEEVSALFDLFFDCVHY
jgi:hypothetical protein